MLKKEIKKIDFIIDYNDESILVNYNKDWKLSIENYIMLDFYIYAGEFTTLDKSGQIIKVAVELYGSKPDSLDQIALIADDDDNLWEISRLAADEE